MKIIVLNGNPDNKNIKFDNYLTELANDLQKKNHGTKIFTLRDMNINHCVGCFGCFVKTPGECVFKDDSAEICRSVVNADFVLFSSPIMMGFTSALLKKANEKLLPIFHPYFEFLNDETRHIKRYKKYPPIGLLLENNERTDKEDVFIISEIYRREAMNFKSSFSFTRFTNDPITELAHEISRI
ncbi:MAG: flavodoxin family protein [Thermodesulfovibrionales bacterium]|nr:flavodoxin family protein [Thermodesulfovibrionales bacterium]